MDEQDAKNFHDRMGLSQCIRCHASLEDVVHHYYCDKCWIIRKLDYLCKQIDLAFKQARLR